MSDNVARLLRENAALRKVAATAARVRRVGMAADQIEESSEAIWRENPDMSRSGTGIVMARMAYDTAIKEFDAALLEAADVFARDPFADDLVLFRKDHT